MSVYSAVRALLPGKKPQGRQRRAVGKWQPWVEPLERRELLDGGLGKLPGSSSIKPICFDFGTAQSPIAPGYIQALPATAYSASTGYGWTAGTGLGATNAGGTNPVTCDFDSGRDATFAVNVPSGQYTLSVLLGDPAQARSGMKLWLNGTQVATGLSTAAGQTLLQTFNTGLVKSQISVRIAVNNDAPDFALDALVVAPAAATPPPQANAGPDLTANEGASIAFAGSVAGGTAPYTYTWEFGDGTTATGTASPSHAYADNGTYTVTFTVRDANGKASADTAVVTAINVAPTPSAGGPYSAPAGTAVAFSGSATDPSPVDTQAGFTWAWSFGDGATSSQQNPSHAYTAPGTYTANLTVTDKDGGSASASATVTVTSATALPPTANAGPNQAGNEGATVTFSGSASGGTAPYTYSWAFGDGTSATGTLTPSHAYADNGTYTVTLTVTDASGQSATSTATAAIANVAPTATFANGGAVNEGSAGAVSFTNPFDPSPVDTAAGFKYSYDFNNDGVFEITDTAAASATVPASYLADGPAARVVHGRIKDKDGGFTDYTTTITVLNVPPTVTVGGPYSGTTGSPISFTGSITDPSPVDTAAGFTFAWSFGDGTTSNVLNPSHAYAAAGTYTVTLTATDKDGGTGTKSTTVTVTAPAPVGQYIVTPFDKIPNFGANPTVVSVQSGAWSDVNTWSTHQLPGAGDVVSIAANTVVTYDVVGTAAPDTVAIQAGGSLRFRTDMTTKLTVTNLLVLAGGELQVGTPTNPVLPQYKAEISIADVPLDTTKDPAQYGHGLIALGKVTMSGTAKNQTFVTLAAAPNAGDTTLSLSQPVTGWQAGDKLVLPDSTEPLPGTTSPSQWEVLTLASVSPDGKTLTLSSPLQYAHPGAKDGQGNISFLPHVGNITRNVVVHSASATGTRGQVFFTYRADVDIRYTQFSGLGRTTNNALDNTTFDSSGNVTHVGTNQQGRYPIQFAHLYGPSAIPADGYQYTFVGNSVFCPLTPMNFRWGIDIHDSDYGLIQDNVVYNWAGAGIIADTGSENFNVIQHNFVVRVNGMGWRADGGGSDIGREGVAFWFGTPNNYVNNNVAANAVGPGEQYGYTYYLTGTAKIPTYQGADPSVAGQSKSMDMHAIPLLSFSGNEVYGTLRGLTIWFLGTSYTSTVQGVGVSTVKDFHAWHVYMGIFAYPINNVVFDGFVQRGEPYGTGIGYYIQDYLNANTVIRNSDIQGLQYGIMIPDRMGDTRDTGQTPGTFTVENTYLRNQYDIYAETMNTTGAASTLSPRTTIIRNVKFDHASASGEWDIYLNFLSNPSDRPGYNWVQGDQFFVYNYNQVAGSNFQVYYNEQAASFIVPQTSSAGIGSPDAGLTNQDNWNKYGLAIAGAVAPSNATTRAKIRGLVV
jgi:PKD repeat protein